MFHKDYKEFIELLLKNKVAYLVVGGHAVIFHGYPRLTSDLDIWFKNTPENIFKVVQSIADFGLGNLGITAKDLMTKGNIIQMGVAPVRIDLVNEIDGVGFEECFANKLVSEVYGLQVNFLNLQDLIKNKKASGRNKDLNDIENLK